MTLPRLICLMLFAGGCGSPTTMADAAFGVDLAVSDFGGIDLTYNTCVYTCPGGQFEFGGTATPLYDASSPPIIGCNTLPGGCTDCACLLSMFGGAICWCNECPRDQLQIECTNGPA
jgi:hypothetical protein